MKPYYEKGGIAIFHGDCREVLASIGGRGFEACVTDPPYHLTEASRRGNGRKRASGGRGFMGKAWDGGHVSFRKETWAGVLASVKPGAPLLSFGGTRTWHRLACAIEDGGFVIKDTLMWLYGNGFPKSLNVGKAVDRALGAEPAPSGRHRTAVGWAKTRLAMGYASNEVEPGRATEPTSERGKQWAGHGTGLKPGWEPVIMGLAPLDGTYAENAMAHGVAGLNIEEARVGRTSALGAKGRWPANVVLTHHADCVRLGQKTIKNPAASVTGNEPSAQCSNVYHDCKRKGFTRHGGDDGLEVVEDWSCAPDCPVLELDKQSGMSRSRAGSPRASAAGGDGWAKTHTGTEHDDFGGASRFFYTSKADGWDRGNRVFQALPLFGVGESEFKNSHPTVKPFDLMVYLLRLLSTPAGGSVVDPFMGSGTTLLAAKALGRPAVGVDDIEEYCELAAARLDDPSWRPL